MVATSTTRPLGGVWWRTTFPSLGWRDVNAASTLCRTLFFADTFPCGAIATRCNKGL